MSISYLEAAKLIQKLLIASIFLISLSGCDVDYWWSRGQPPSPQQLLSRSKMKLDAELSETKRSDLKEEFAKLASMFEGANSNLAQGIGGDKLKVSLSEINQSLSNLEGKLSFGSRPPYGELIGQFHGLQTQANEAGMVDKSVFTLYTSRVYFFMANELSVPAPVLPAPSYS